MNIVTQLPQSSKGKTDFSGILSIITDKLGITDPLFETISLSTGGSIVLNKQDNTVMVEKPGLYGQSEDRNFISNLEKLIRQANKNKEALQHTGNKVKVSFILKYSIVELESLIVLFKKLLNDNIEIDPMFVVPIPDYHKEVFGDMSNKTGLTIGVVDPANTHSYTIEPGGKNEENLEIASDPNNMPTVEVNGNVIVVYIPVIDKNHMSGVRAGVKLIVDALKENPSINTIQFRFKNIKAGEFRFILYSVAKEARWVETIQCLLDSETYHNNKDEVEAVSNTISQSLVDSGMGELIANTTFQVVNEGNMAEYIEIDKLSK